MKKIKFIFSYVSRGLPLFLLVIAVAIVTGFSLTESAVAGNGKNQGAGGSTPGNNLSFPVIDAEGVPKTLRGIFGAPDFTGSFWYYWELPELTDGIPPEPVHGACPADPDDLLLCDDYVDGTAVGEAPPDDAVEVYPQQDVVNTWQAAQVEPGIDPVDSSLLPVDVHWIDWGDALEAVDWDLRSQVRAEIVLIQDLAEPLVEFEMKHLSGLGIDEMWGTTGEQLQGMNATVYSPCARFTIQRILTERDDPELEGLVWVPSLGWAGTDSVGNALINTALFNKAIWQTGEEEDPEAYNAEINIKGKIIYGYTWNVRESNEGPGDYRMTFSFDEVCPIADDPETPEDESYIAYLNTFFTDGVTQIVPIEEEDIELLLPIIGEGDENNNPSGGAVPVIDFFNNLTYVDVRVNAKESGGGGSNH